MAKSTTELTFFPLEIIQFTRIWKDLWLWTYVIRGKVKDWTDWSEILLTVLQTNAIQKILGGINIVCFVNQYRNFLGNLSKLYYYRVHCVNINI